jgi:hypothetical protein
VFSVDPSFTHLDATANRVLALLQSINAISVKVPGFEAAPATAYVAAWEAGAGVAMAVIYLHYTQIHRCVAYEPEPREFAMTDLPTVIDEAKDFLESMGFMLDDPVFGTLAPDRKQRLIDRTPVLHRDLRAFAAARETEVSAGGEVVELTEAIADADTGAPVPAPAEEKPAPDDPKRAEAVGKVLMSF